MLNYNLVEQWGETFLSIEVSKRGFDLKTLTFAQYKTLINFDFISCIVICSNKATVDI